MPKLTIKSLEALNDSEFIIHLSDDTFLLVTADEFANRFPDRMRDDDLRTDDNWEPS